VHAEQHLRLPFVVPHRFGSLNRKFGNIGKSKTTIEIPDPLFRKVKSEAVEHGQTLKDFVAEALPERLAPNASMGRLDAAPWMQGFGKLGRLRKETVPIQASIDEAFEAIELEDRT
jgi:hypothetical protein